PQKDLKGPLKPFLCFPNNVAVALGLKERGQREREREGEEKRKPFRSVLSLLVLFFCTNPTQRNSYPITMGFIPNVSAIFQVTIEMSQPVYWRNIRYQGTPNPYQNCIP